MLVPPPLLFVAHVSYRLQSPFATGCTDQLQGITRIHVRRRYRLLLVHCSVFRSQSSKTNAFLLGNRFRHSPNSLELSGKNELVIFVLTFLTSTWYIKNPFLKSKLVEVFPLCRALVCHSRLRVSADAVFWDPRIWSRAYRCTGPHVEQSPTGPQVFDEFLDEFLRR